MSDTCTINSMITNADGSVTANSTLSITGVSYNQSFNVPNNVVDAANGIKAQAEEYRQSVLTAQIAAPNATTVNSLVGTVIQL